MSGIKKIRELFIQFSLLRGMLSYALIWPSSSIAQQYIEQGSLSEVNVARAARFAFFGTFFMAPVCYGWMRFSNRYFKKKSLKMAMTSAVSGQVCYSPLAVAYFLFGMSVIELNSFEACVDEVRDKFWPTYSAGLMFWPVAKTLNFYFISDNNRIVFASACSFVWTMYLVTEPKQSKTGPLKNGQ